MNLLQYLHRRKARKLAERILTHQTICMAKEIREDIITCSIKTAEEFYEKWEEKLNTEQ